MTGLGRSKLYQLMDAGEIRSVKVGKRRLIPVSALREFVARLEAEQAE
jgi:excisionase family DNA binding protein